MGILIKIDDLLNANKVESERIEFKKGWNPNAIMRTICAFANDFENTGSGYILIGVHEENGIANRPVVGIPESQIDKIQQEIHQFCRQIQPSYFPRISVEEIDDKKIIVIWVPGGSNRPYKVPDEVTAKRKSFNYRIRWGTASIVPNREQEQELLQLTAQIPFDDRVNQQVSVNNLDFGLMREHLASTGSRLYELSARMTIEELADKMNLCSGQAELNFPKNVGLLMFSTNPTQYFSSAHIDIVEFPMGEGADTFQEKVFKGPIQIQLKDALHYLQSHIIKSKVIKTDVSAKAKTVFNYPFKALEEALPNAVYHRNYQESEPIEVRVLPDRIIIISYNGADPSLKQRDFDNGTIRSRRYRNRRIGGFLKELELTEGRGTEIPRLQRALIENNSPKAIFNIDEPYRRYFVIELPIHPAFLPNQTGIEMSIETSIEDISDIIGYEHMTDRQKEVVSLIASDNRITYNKLKYVLKISTDRGLASHIRKLKELGSIERIGSTRGAWKVNHK